MISASFYNGWVCLQQYRSPPTLHHGDGSDSDAVHDELNTLAASEARGPADVLPVPRGQAAALRSCRFGCLIIAHQVRRLEDDRRRTDVVSAKDLTSGSLL